MANPNFTATMSSNEIWRDLDDTRCITDDLDTIESNITALQTGKANSDHTHSGYADATHTHTEYAPSSHEHSGYAELNHSHEYAPFEHKHFVFSGTSASTYKLVYVATDGNDDNDGFTTSTPMGTIKGVIRKYAEIYKMLDIRLADGTYNENIGSISLDHCNLSIRSISEDKDKVTLNITTTIETNLPKFRLYNITINVTAKDVRPISVTAGVLYASGVRFNVPTDSTMPCVNVYNACSALLMHCVCNGGTGANAGATIYGNQAIIIKAINCTSERTVNIAFHAHNGCDIWYTNTMTANTVAKETYYGKCVART